MPFYAPSWTPKLPDIPDSIPICDFMLDESFGRNPLNRSRAPFTCGLSGRSYSVLEVKERVEYLARGLAKEFGWHPNQGTEWDKVVGVFSLNTVSRKYSLVAHHASHVYPPKLYCVAVERHSGSLLS
jgi:hypothetical protein